VTNILSEYKVPIMVLIFIPLIFGALYVIANVFKPELKYETLTGVNLEMLEAEKTYSFSLNVTNPFDNMTIQIYTVLSTDPEQLADHVELSSTCGDGTQLEASQTLLVTYYLYVKPNEYSAYGEYYIRVKGAY